MTALRPQDQRLLRSAFVLTLLAALTLPQALPALFGPPQFEIAAWTLSLGLPVLLLGCGVPEGARPRLVVPLGAYLLCVAITGLWSVDRPTTAVEGAALVAMALVALAVGRALRADWAFERLALATLLALLAVGQAVAFAHHVEVGLAERLAVYLLPAGWGGYPELGLLVALQFAIGAALLLTQRRRAAVAAALLLTVATVVQAAFLYARVAWVSIAILSLVLPLVVGVRGLSVRRLAITGTIVAIALAVATATNPSLRRLAAGAVTGGFGGAGIVDGVELRVASIDMRTAIWARTLRMIGDHWRVGVGFGNFQEVYEPNYNPETNDDTRRGVHAHNAFLQQAAETGLVGGLTFAAVWAVALWTSARAAREARRLIDVALFGCVLVLFVQSLGDYFSYTLDGPRGRLTALIWVMLAWGATPPACAGAAAPPRQVQGATS